VAFDDGMRGAKVLSLFDRFEALHFPFSEPRRSMRISGTIVEIATLPMFAVGNGAVPRNAVVPQLASPDHPRHMPRTRQPPPAESLGARCVVPVNQRECRVNCRRGRRGEPMVVASQVAASCPSLGCRSVYHQRRLPMGLTPPDGIDVPKWRC
jgi:hypothetical protein